jgi:hypothetical protein
VKTERAGNRWPKVIHRRDAEHAESDAGKVSYVDVDELAGTLGWSKNVRLVVAAAGR